MRKVLTFILVFVCMATFAVADTHDMSNLTFDQLVDLHHRIAVEIMSRPEWKEVEVPAGEWAIGEDIPAGFYSVKNIHDRVNIVRIEDKAGKTAGLYKGLSADEVVGKAEFKKGLIFICEYPVLLAPPISLGF